MPGDLYRDSGVGYFHLGGHLLADIIKATPFTGGYKMILKCEISVISRMVFEKRPRGDGSAQAST